MTNIEFVETLNPTQPTTYGHIPKTKGHSNVYKAKLYRYRLTAPAERRLDVGPTTLNRRRADVQPTSFCRRDIVRWTDGRPIISRHDADVSPIIVCRRADNRTVVGPSSGLQRLVGWVDGRQDQGLLSLQCKRLPTKQPGPLAPLSEALYLIRLVRLASHMKRCHADLVTKFHLTPLTL